MSIFYVTNIFFNNFQTFEDQLASLRQENKDLENEKNALVIEKEQAAEEKRSLENVSMHNENVVEKLFC